MSFVVARLVGKDDKQYIPIALSLAAIRAKLLGRHANRAEHVLNVGDWESSSELTAALMSSI